MTTNLVSENDIYRYLGLAVAVLIVIYFIHKMVEAQANVIEGMSNDKDKEAATINELLPKIKEVVKTNRADLHLSEDREKIEDIIIAYKSLIGTKTLKVLTTTDFTKNDFQLKQQLFLYNQSMEAFDKLMKQVDRLKNKSDNDGSSSGGGSSMF